MIYLLKEAIQLFEPKPISPMLDGFIFGAPIRVTGKGYGNTQCCVTFSNNHFLKPSL